MRSAVGLLLLLVSAATPAEPRVDSVRVDKSDHTLHLMSGGEILHSFHVVFGGNPIGHKQQEGDERTPEGKYLLDFKKADSSFYRSIHISYPNEADVESAKRRGVSPGGAVFVHGQKNGLGWLSFASRFANWTDGCIALSNSDMDQVWRLVSTPMPIEIVP